MSVAGLLDIFRGEHALFLRLSQAIQHSLLAQDVASVQSGFDLLRQGLAAHADAEARLFADTPWPTCRWPQAAYTAEHDLLVHRLQQLQACCARHAQAESPSAQRQACLQALQEAGRLTQTLEHHFEREESDWLQILTDQHPALAAAFALRIQLHTHDTATQIWAQAAGQFCRDWL